MIVGYADESGHSSETRVVAMGGIIGSHIDMPKLGEDWFAMLARHGVQTFHMTDLESSRGEFVAWTEHQRRALLADVFECLDGFPFCYFGVAVVTKQHQQAAAALPLGGVFTDSWFMCFQLSVSTIARTAFWREGDPTIREKVAMFHDQQQEYQGRAVDAFAYLKSAASYKDRLGTCTPADKKKVIQLQPADLVAYETRKLFENSLYDSKREMRWPMKQLQQRISSWNYIDLGGAIPNIPGSPLAQFKRSHIALVGDELNVVEEPKRLGEGL